jgi:hypothetical protein
MPKPIDNEQLIMNNEDFWNEVDSICKQNRAVFLKIERDTWDEEFIIHHSSFIISPPPPLARGGVIT